MSQNNGINELTAAYQADRPELSDTPAPAVYQEAPQSLVSSDPVQQLLANLDLWTGTVTDKSGGRGRAAKTGGAGKTELTGIKKLRELILELAVRGKLVPQNPNDEPASALLKRIDTEKARLAKDGKIKKPAKLPPVSDDEQPFELPDGWEWVRLGKLTEVITSGSRDWAKYYSETGAKFITMSNLSRGHYQLRLDTLRFVTPPQNSEGQRTKLQSGDIVISITGDVGNLGLIPPNFGDAYINQHSCLVRLCEEQRGRYIAEYLRTPSAKYQFDAPQRGVKNSFRLSDVDFLIVPLPPLAEQQRIVERVDQLMALCDQLEQSCLQQLDNHQQLVDTLLAELTAAESSPDGQTLESELIPSGLFPSGLFPSKQSTNPAWQRIHNQFDRLFSGAIQTSVRAENGRLGSGEALPNNQPVAQGSGPDSMDTQALPILPPDILVGTGNSYWAIDRLKETILQLAVMGRLVPQNESDEPASALLERIDAEKARLVKDGKIKKPKKLPPISDDEKPFELPEGWEWCRLDDLSIQSEAGWSPQCEDTPRDGDNWGVLKVSAVTWGTFKAGENKALPNHLEPRPEYEVKPRDFLISRANTADLVARSVVVQVGAPTRLMMSDKIIRFEFSEYAYPGYINMFNNCSLARAYYQQVAGGTSSSMKNVSRVQIQSLVIPLPPLAEQQRIVERVDQLFALCDQLKAKQQDANQTRQQLTEALVTEVLNS